MNHYIGAHLSSATGFYQMGQTALKIGANTFQFFCRNPRGSKAKPLNPADLERLRQLLVEHDFGPLVAHAPYIMNACSKDEGIRGLAAEMVRLRRAVRSAGRRQEAWADPAAGVWTPGRGMAGSAERRDPVLLVDAAVQRDARRYDGGFPLL